MASYTDLETLLPSPSAGDTVPATWFEALHGNIALLASIAADYIDTLETRTNTAFGDLTTVGPRVTVDTGESALVLHGADLSNNTAGQFGIMGVEVTGASSASPSDTAVHQSATANARASVVGLAFYSGSLTPGMNTFTAKYRTAAGGGTMTASRRWLIVIPLP